MIKKTYTSYINYREKPIHSELKHLDIELTERCNNNCIHCCINLPIHDREAKRKEMSLEEIKDILIQAHNLGCLEVRFTGGEPLLFPHFVEVYKITRRLGMRVRLFTNARLITPKLAKLFSEISPLEPIEVSIYGMREESYFENTGQVGAYESFKRGVQLLIDYDIPFMVKTVFLPSLRNEIQEIDDWSKGITWMKEKPGITVFFDLRLRRDDSKKNELIKSLRLAPEDAVNFLRDHNGNFDFLKENYWQNMSHLPGKQLFKCNAGKEKLAIDAYGNIQPCLPMRHPDLVLPRGTSLITGLRFFSNLREIQATNEEYIERCANCFLRNLCEQCPAKSYSETGTLDTPVEYYCKIAHALARDFGWLGKSENAWEIKNWENRIRK